LTRDFSFLVAPLVRLTVGGTVAASGLGMLVCAGVGFEDGDAGVEFTVCGLAAVALGFLLLSQAIGSRSAASTVRPATGFAAVTLSWMLVSAVGAVPFLLTGTFGSGLDAYFEAVSGFTTTGATLIPDIEAQPDAVLLWRSLTQWLGGVGIIVLVVAIAPVSGPGIQRAFYAESTGLPSDRLTPRIIDTAKIIATIYLSLSALAAVAYFVAGMNVFDAINHAMTTVATGGFSTKDLSLGYFDSTSIEAVAVVFMFLGGINFAFYWKAIRHKDARLQYREVRAYAIILLGLSAAVGASVALHDDISGVGRIVLESLFSVVTVLSSTGFTTEDFDDWNSFAKTLIFLATFVGACAGSTSGGIKVFRVVLLTKIFGQEITRQLKPATVQVLRAGPHVFRDSVRQAVLGFFLAYVLVYTLGTVVMAASGLDFLSAAGASASTLNLIGLGLGEIGATGDYEAMSALGKSASCVLMIAGRLEIFTVVALLAAVVDAFRNAMSHRVA
jgi:trk system potassium uptake protein TrkH